MPSPAHHDDFARLQAAAAGVAEPTPAQAAAGNYRLGATSWRGMPIRIETPAFKVREGTDERGKPWRSIMAAHYGYFFGTTGADGDGVDVFVGASPESPIAWIINQTQRDGRFDEHKVMVGFDSADSAVRAYTHSYAKGWDRFDRTPVRMTYAQLRWWLNYADKSRRASLMQLPASLRKETTMDSTQDDRQNLPLVLWDSAGNLLAGQTMEALIYRLRALDGTNDLIMDPLTMADVMEDAQVVTLDALVSEVGKLKPKMELILKLMQAVQTPSGITATSMEISEPFRRFGGVHVAVIFAMSDGQTISIMLHNPDSTPAKLTPMDLMVSWKWLLNKRDITAVVAPENGKDLSPREVATRVMRVASGNAKAFARTSALAANRSATIKGLREELTTKQAELADLNDQITTERVAAGERAAAREAEAAAAAAAAAIEPAPEGWENRAGKMIASEDPAAGGIVDFETKAGTWFVVPNDDALDFKRDGYATRADALAALAAAVEAKRAAEVQPDPAPAVPAKSVSTFLAAQTYVANFMGGLASATLVTVKDSDTGEIIGRKLVRSEAKAAITAATNELWRRAADSGRENYGSVVVRASALTNLAAAQLLREEGYTVTDEIPAGMLPDWLTKEAEYDIKMSTGVVIKGFKFTRLEDRGSTASNPDLYVNFAHDASRTLVAYSLSEIDAKWADGTIKLSGDSAGQAVPDSPEVALLRDIAAGKHDAEGYRAMYSRISAVVQALGETLTGPAAEAADAAIMHWADVEEATPL